MRTRQRHGIGTSAATLALVAILVTGGVSVYYAFAAKNDGGKSNSGFNLTLTNDISTIPHPKGSVLVVIPAGINSDPQLTFEPRNLVLVLGVNSTIVFDNQDTTEHIIESLQWPSGVGFTVWLIQDQTGTLKFNQTGYYQYNFELNPAAENGTVVVEAP